MCPAEQGNLHLGGDERRREKAGDPGMIVAGCDVGSATGEGLTMKHGDIASFSISPSTTRPEMTAQMAVDETLGKGGSPSLDELDYVVGTG